MDKKGLEFTNFIHSRDLKMTSQFHRRATINFDTRYDTIFDARGIIVCPSGTSGSYTGGSLAPDECVVVSNHVPSEWGINTKNEFIRVAAAESLTALEAAIQRHFKPGDDFRATWLFDDY